MKDFERCLYMNVNDFAFLFHFFAKPRNFWMESVFSLKFSYFLLSNLNEIIF